MEYNSQQLNNIIVLTGLILIIEEGLLFGRS